MDIKSITVVILLCAYHTAFFGTELEIVNRTDGVLTINPIVSLAGRTSSGKSLEHIAHNSSARYNSGIYKIVGINVRLKRISPDKKSYRISVGKMRNWPTVIGVTNRNALFVLGDPQIHSPHIGRVYLDKNDLNDPQKMFITTFEFTQPTAVESISH